VVWKLLKTRQDGDKSKRCLLRALKFNALLRRGVCAKGILEKWCRDVFWGARWEREAPSHQPGWPDELVKKSPKIYPNPFYVKK
jgi:hypothetical protein